MMYYFNVYAGSKHMDLVKAFDESDAIKQVFMKFGSASKYRGLGLDSFRAERA